MRIRAAAFLAGPLFALCSTAAAAQQQQFSQPNTHDSWNSGPPNGSVIDVTYYVSASTASLHANALPLIQQAAAAWNGAGASVNLVYGGTSGATPGITFDTAALAFLPSLTTNTTIPAGLAPDGHTLRQITDSDVTISSTFLFPWHFDATTPVPGGSMDFYSAMLREFGAGLGLGVAALADTASVMDAFLIPGESHRTLSASDIAALQQVYGTPEPATWTLFGLGLLGVGAMSRRPRPRAGRPS